MPLEEESLTMSATNTLLLDLIPKPPSSSSLKPPGVSRSGAMCPPFRRRPQTTLAIVTSPRNRSKPEQQQSTASAFAAATSAAALSGCSVPCSSEEEVVLSHPETPVDDALEHTHFNRFQRVYSKTLAKSIAADGANASFRSEATALVTSIREDGDGKSPAAKQLGCQAAVPIEASLIDDGDDEFELLVASVTSYRRAAKSKMSRPASAL